MILQLFTFYTVDHTAYVYTLGVCDINRRSFSCPGSPHFFEDVGEMKKLGMLPWWYVEGQTSSKRLQKWPEKPENLKYERVHEHCEDEPWCTYVLRHNSTVAASALTLEDLNRFVYSKVTTKKLFSMCRVENGDKRKVEEMGQLLRYHLEQCKVLIPRSIVMKKCIDIERWLLKNTGEDKTELCKKILEEVGDGAVTKKVVETSVQQCITNQNLQFLTWLQDIREIKEFNVSKEIQLNEWFLTRLKDELHRLGFVTNQDFVYNEYSIFGRSRPDFSFFKKQNNFLKVGILIQPPCELQESKIFSGALEFKLDISNEPKRVYPQAFAEMIRVGHDRLIDSLKLGKVVDNIVVYALLVGYNKEECLPLKYQADFHNNSFNILVGEKELFTELFPTLVIIGFRSG